MIERTKMCDETYFDYEDRRAQFYDARYAELVPHAENGGFYPATYKRLFADPVANWEDENWPAMRTRLSKNWK